MQNGSGGELLHIMLTRRSTSALAEPGPDPAQLDLLLRAAATVPDHGSLRPWRFVVVSGAARRRFGEALVDVALERQPDLPSAAVEKMRAKAFVAPTFVVIVSSPHAGNKVPIWEQEASAACTGYALTLAAQTLGLGAMWKSAPFRGGGDLSTLLELRGEEQILGWVNVGTPSPGATDRAAARGSRRTVAIADVASRLTGSGLTPVSPSLDAGSPGTPGAGWTSGSEVATAVEVQRLPCQERGLLGGQVDTQLTDVIRLADATDRDGLRQPVAEVAEALFPVDQAE